MKKLQYTAFKMLYSLAGFMTGYIGREIMQAMTITLITVPSCWALAVIFLVTSA